MCGIAGWFGNGIAWEPASLLSALRHRGPDGEGAWRDPRGRALLVHTRLAILDPSAAGAQPMGYDAQSRTVVAAGGSARYWIVFNGEIYNFRELQSELEAQGEVFQGRSDSDVLLRLLVRQGKAAVHRLAGMFAFAFYDSDTGTALLARDAFGIKPLYYSDADRVLVFASEVRPLRASVAESHFQPDVMRDTLLWGSVPEPATCAGSIRELPAGCLLEWDERASRVERWNHLRFSDTVAPEDATACTRAALIESVRRHLVSDVPVGIFLSGGIDSTALLALVRRLLGPGADLRTFSIGFDDAAYDESSTARRTALHFGTRHVEWRMTAADGRAEVAAYLNAMDQPTTNGFNTWCVSKLARREGVKVALSGLGADEMFGGYGSFAQVPRFLRLHRALGLLRPAAATLLERTPPGSRWRRLAAFLRGPASTLGAFHVQRGIFNEAEARELAAVICGVDPGPSAWQVEDLPDDPADAVSFLELTRYMRNQLLRDSDVFSMAHGLELRVPFVDERLFSAVGAIPAHLRLRAGKQLLLDAVPEIPEWVRNHPKRGFRFPLQEWLQSGFETVLDPAEKTSTVPLVTWYRKWALAAVLLTR
jgi:asparagine synthase (glutamine-hydrolysing)